MHDDTTGGERREDARLASEDLFETAAFKQFDRGIDLSLAKLVARWQAYAAPQAKRPPGVMLRRGVSQPFEDASPDAM